MLTQPPLTAVGAAMPTKTAIIYLRVSTTEQAKKGGREEGFSIPAQREADTRKAESLGAAVIAEFVDAGESGTKIDKRDGLQDLLVYIREHRVDYCIVHKLDRLARSRADDVAIHFALKQAGVTSIIWATGFAVDYGWLKLPVLDAKGKPRQRRGVSAVPGLYFLGLPWLSRRGSSFIWGVWHDAKFIADQVVIQRSYEAYRPSA